MEIFAIATTVVDWKNYIFGCNDILGRSPTRMLDEYKICPNSYGESFIASLAEFKDESANPISFLQNEREALKHVSITFLCEVEQELFFQIMKILSIGFVVTCNNDTSKIRRFIITGSILMWKDLIIAYMNQLYDSQLREFLYNIYFLLTRKSYKMIFSQYKILRLSDGSYILERK